MKAAWPEVEIKGDIVQGLLGGLGKFLNAPTRFATIAVVTYILEEYRGMRKT